MCYYPLIHIYYVRVFTESYAADADNQRRALNVTDDSATFHVTQLDIHFGKIYQIEWYVYECILIIVIICSMKIVY